MPHLKLLPCLAVERIRQRYQTEFPLTSDTESERQSVALPTIRELEILRDRILSQLKLGKQATGYKTAHKVLNRFISELIGSV